MKQCPCCNGVAMGSDDTWYDMCDPCLDDAVVPIEGEGGWKRGYHHVCGWAEPNRLSHEYRERTCCEGDQVKSAGGHKRIPECSCGWTGQAEASQRSALTHWHQHVKENKDTT